jgi:hypothetical protein
MGYDPCTTPGAKWFAIQPTMLAAERSYRALLKESSSVKDLCAVYRTRLEIARAISLMVGLVPAFGDAEKILQSAAQSPGARTIGCQYLIEAFATPTFQVSYSGSGQYGVPNYTFYRGEETEYATNGPGQMFHLAYAERLEYVKTLREKALWIFFDVYWDEKERDLTHYGYWGEEMEPEEVIEIVVSKGVFRSHEEAVAACADGDVSNIHSIPAVVVLVEQLQRKRWQEYFKENWTEFDETAAIWHGHSS